MREPAEVIKEILEVAGQMDDEALIWIKIKQARYCGKERRAKVRSNLADLAARMNELVKELQEIHLALRRD